MIAFFSVHCSKKKGGGLGLGALALAGGGGSSSSSSSSTNNATKTVTPGGGDDSPGGGGNGGDSTVTKCEINGDKPVYLKRAYTLSYDCVLNTAVQGKTLTIDYENTIVELPKSSFKLPETKNASENFTVKTKQNQAFSLTLKIGAKSFTKKDFSATKDIPPPTAAQIIIEEFTPTLTVGTFPNAGGYSLVIFNNTFYLFPFNDRKYYSSSDGKTWKGEGNVHAEFLANDTYPSLTVYKNKLWLLQPTTKKLYSTSIPASGTALNFIKIAEAVIGGGIIKGTNMVVFQDKIVLRGTTGIYSLKTTNWDKELDIDGDQSMSRLQRLVYENKLWTFGGWDMGPLYYGAIYSFDGKDLKKEGDLPTNLYYAGARVFANGILLIGGNISRGNASDKLYWSPYGKSFQSVKTEAKLGGPITNGSVLKSENEIWVVKKTGDDAKVYKITFDPTK